MYSKSKHTFCVQCIFFENRAVYEIMWKNVVERGRTQMAIRRMRIACCIPKAANTHSQYLILIVFSPTTMVACTRLIVTLDIVCLVLIASSFYRCLLHLIDIVC